MKKSILLSLLVCLYLLSNAQQTHFPDSNAVWSVYTQKYFVNGDSTLGSTVYKKYYFSNSPTLASFSFYTLLREDTAAKKVYTTFTAGQEKLLYDFSLNINDSATIFPIYVLVPLPGDSLRIQVEAVDTITILGINHKRLKIKGLDMNSGFEEYWIEGIGSTMGLFAPGSTGIVAFDVNYPVLACFERDGNLLYHNPIFSTCYNPVPNDVSVHENRLLTEIKPYPNPAKDMLHFTALNPNCRISIFNHLGQIQANQVKLTNSNIDVSNLKNGMYFFTITDANQNRLSSGKFIKE